uniref:Uncharacterized protein n=1 Tax=Panagrolaimus sp. PS1159 TaxID=55785 RepID=A0AC35F325_9BILA
MQNKAGRYYIAMGYQNMSENNYEKVSVNKETYYTRKSPFIYSIKVITKAAFYYNETNGKFVNDGIIVQKTDDDNLIKFYTNKMSIFSVESLSPQITENDAYEPTAITIIEV